MVKVLEARKARVAWRVTDLTVFDTLCRLRSTEMATDDVAYKDPYAAHKIVMAYRAVLRRRRPDLRMHSRIIYHRGGFRWFVQVERRAVTGSA